MSAALPQLAATTSLLSGDEFLINHSGNPRRISAASVQSAILSPIGDLFLVDFYQSGDGSDWLPAFLRAQAAVATDVAAILQLPAGDFNLSGTFNIWRKLMIRGGGMGYQYSTCATRLLWPKNMDGVRLWSSQLETGAVAAGVPADGNAGTAGFEEIGLFCTDGTTTSGIGIHCTAAPHLHRVNVQQFGGNGVDIHGSAQAEHSNANQWVIDNCVIRSNKGWGLHVDGADANAGVAMMILGGNNTLGDFYDFSVLGNTYIALQSDANRQIAYSNPESSTSFYFGCYNEESGGATNFGSGSLLVGGAIGFESNVPTLVISDSGGGFGAVAGVVNTDVSGAVTKILPIYFGSGYTAATTVTVGAAGGGTGLVITPNIVGGHITSYTIDNGGSGYSNGYGSCTGNLKSGGSHGGLVTAGAFISNNYYQSGDRYIQGALCFNGNEFFTGRVFNDSASDYDEFYPLFWNESTKSFQAKGIGNNVSIRWPSAFSTTETGGRADPIPAYSMEFPTGFWLGAGSTGRQMTNGTAAPTTGQWARGDIVWNTAPSAGGSMGWMCVTTGDFAGSPTPVFKAMPNLAA